MDLTDDVIAIYTSELLIDFFGCASYKLSLGRLLGKTCRNEVNA